MRFSYIIPVLFGLTLCALPAPATTKGLNQIVTPNVQPFGILSVSFQPPGHPAEVAGAGRHAAEAVEFV